MTSPLLPHLSAPPTLKDCEDLVSKVKAFYKTTDDNGLISFNYRSTTYGDFTHPHAREMRGITFDQHGNLLARPWLKFFNYGENPLADRDIVPTFGTIIHVTEKIDGSLVYPVLYDGHILFKTKASSLTPMALSAHTLLNPQTEMLIYSLLNEGYTPMFELIGPCNPNVLSYPTDRLVYIGKRNMATGAQYSPTESDGFPDYAREFFGADIPTLLSVCDESEDHIEGYVVMFETGNMLKFKTKWYKAMHRIVSDIRDEEAIARLVITENLDDMLSAVPMAFHDEILKTAQQISVAYNTDLRRAEEIYDNNRHLPAKEYAQFCYTTGTPKHIMGIAMDLYKGKFDISKYNDRFISNKRWRNLE